MLTQLLQNRIDYALMDDLVIEYLLSHYAKETASNLAIGRAPVVVRPLHFAIRRSRPDAESIIARFNAKLPTLVADHTYHKLLHVDWIVADADGDGVPEYVPASDKVGKTPPQHAYVLMSPTQPVAQGGARFYLGGTTYTDWAAVPDRYKVSDPQNPDPRRSTASIFKFVW